MIKSPNQESKLKAKIGKHGQMFQLRSLPRFRWKDRQPDPQNRWKSSLEQPEQEPITHPLFGNLVASLNFQPAF